VISAASVMEPQSLRSNSLGAEEWGPHGICKCRVKCAHACVFDSVFGVQGQIGTVLVDEIERESMLA